MTTISRPIAPVPAKPVGTCRKCQSALKRVYATRCFCTNDSCYYSTSEHSRG